MEDRVEEEREKYAEVEAEAAALKRTILHKEDAMGAPRLWSSYLLN